MIKKFGKKVAKKEIISESIEKAAKTQLKRSHFDIKDVFIERSIKRHSRKRIREKMEKEGLKSFYELAENSMKSSLSTHNTSRLGREVFKRNSATLTNWKDIIKRPNHAVSNLLHTIKRTYHRMKVKSKDLFIDRKSNVR